MPVVYYLTERDVMVVLAATGQQVQLRDYGLLSSAVARPASSAFGEDAYPGPWVKAAALLHSLAQNHPFVDGNKRAAWTGAWTFVEANGWGRLRADFDVDAAEDFVQAVARADENDLERVADRLREHAETAADDGTPQQRPRPAGPP